MKKSKFIDAIRELSQHHSQKEICEKLHCSRSTVHVMQKRLGFTARKPGMRAPEISAPTERKVIGALRARRLSQKAIAAKLGVREWAVRSIAERNKINRYGIPPEQLAKIDAEIFGHSNYLRDIARKYDISRKAIRKRAGELLGCERFCPGAVTPPLSSPFPQKNLYAASMTPAQFATALIAYHGLNFRNVADASRIAAILTYSAVEGTPELRDSAPAFKAEFTAQLLQVFQEQLVANADAAAPQSAWVN